jgi:uncharacterized protein YndB with AHSA1/START domain
LADDEIGRHRVPEHDDDDRLPQKHRVRKLLAVGRPEVDRRHRLAYPDEAARPLRRSKGGADQQGSPGRNSRESHSHSLTHGSPHSTPAECCNQIERTNPRRELLGNSAHENNGLADTSTRRRLLTGAAIAISGLAVGAEASARARQATSGDKPGSENNRTRTSLHQAIELKASPHRIYEALLTAARFAALTGMSAKIDANAGGAFSTFGGMIVGRNIELVADQRIVQAWRPATWKAGIYSIVKFELQSGDSETTLLLDHTGFPVGDFEGLDSGWHERYWEPLKKYLA